MMRHFFFVFLVWGAIYLSIIGLLYGLWGITDLANWQHIIAALASAFYALWLAGRFYDEND